MIRNGKRETGKRETGNGPVTEAGKTAVVHYTCRYRGLTAVSSREARTLGGNRTIAEPLEFKAGVLCELS